MKIGDLVVVVNPQGTDLLVGTTYIIEKIHPSDSEIVRLQGDPLWYSDARFLRVIPNTPDKDYTVEVKKSDILTITRDFIGRRDIWS